MPPVYRANNGHFVQNSFILYGYIEGETKKDWSDNEIISLVDNFTKLLLVLKDYEVPDFVKNNDDKYMKGYNIEYCHDVFRPQILQLEIPEDTKTLILETIDLVYSKLSDFNKLPKQLVHGDLNEMNSIFKDGINIGIIDFGVSYDPVIYDPVIYDLGEFCYRFALPWETEEFREDRYELIIKTFEKTLPLSSAEKDLLPYMILRRHMMDIMLALQYYRSNQANMLIPIKTLTEKAKAFKQKMTRAREIEEEMLQEAKKKAEAVIEQAESKAQKIEDQGIQKMEVIQNRLLAREEKMDEKLEKLEQEKLKLGDKQKELELSIQDQVNKLAEIAGLSKQDAKQKLMDEIQVEYQADFVAYIEKLKTLKKEE